jgi:heat shock protein HtpX
MIATVAVPPAVVAGVVGLIVAGPILLVVLFVVVGVGVAAIVWIRSTSRLGDLGGAAADPKRHARLVNLVDGLCVSAGVRTPELRVVDTPGCNLAVVGRDPAHAALVVTSGLLADLTRMELEGALATGVVELRRGDVAPATVAAAIGPFAVRMAVDPRRDRVVDAAAAALTRYPPGLVAAYLKLQEHGTAVPGTPRRSSHLWLVDPEPVGSPPASYRVPLQERIDALAEL